MLFATIAIFSAAPIVHAACNLTIGQEYPPQDEDLQIAAVSSGNVKQGTAQLPKEVVRGAHGKTNGCARAKWVVDEGVPEHLSHGVFSSGASYDAWVRFSNGAGNSKEGDDRDVDVRGLGVKLLGVQGQKNLPDHENTTQDFIFISSAGGNAFFTRTVKDYLGLPSSIAHCASCLAAQKDLNAQYTVPNPLNITYGSLVNYVLAPSANDRSVGVKYWMAPCDPSKTVPSSNKTNGDSTINRNFQRDAIAEQLALASGTPVCMQFSVQMQTDACKMPMEDASIVWDSPLIPIAKLHFGLQHVSNSNQLSMCENLSFNPWHSLKVHRPAGGVSRSRKRIYLEGSENRYKMNGGGCAHVAPNSVCLQDDTNMLKPAAQCPFRHLMSKYLTVEG